MKPQPSSNMQRCIPTIRKIRVLKVTRMILNDALDEEEVVQVDGSTEPDADVDPVTRLASVCSRITRMIEIR